MNIYTKRNYKLKFCVQKVPAENIIFDRSHIAHYKIDSLLMENATNGTALGQFLTQGLESECSCFDKILCLRGLVNFITKVIILFIYAFHYADWSLITFDIE